MKKIFLFILFFVSFTLISCDSSKQINLNYSNYTNPHQAYEVLELGFNYEKEVTNPYNSEEIAMDAVISFNNKTVSVPLFYYE